MSQLTTISTLRDHAEWSLRELLPRLDLTEAEAFDDFLEAAQDLRDSINAPDVIYTFDAWEIVGNFDFLDADDDELDFGLCRSSFDALMMEARAKVRTTFDHVLQEQIERLALDLYKETAA